MDNKRWSFRIPGDPEGSLKDIDISEIKSVYDLLDLMRKDEVQNTPQIQASRLNTKPKAKLIPFISRMTDTRRHPSA
ncbi:hypothetical protein [Paenibacillus tianjinensis]|uniref:Uncharacterized protein n=1 Tax=Paenibacillus tianjinensis TaxID=2810347 RepID=A0ABX7LCR0_9BACL|nr:hypothetical protein [Paenibacillus tianjinensis]QSF45726.1 hypothetical protein JRJ22_03540 [Paenibacillus tianjinensis]